MKITTLRKKAKSNALEVEDIIQAAKEKLPGLVEELKRLSIDCGWSNVGWLADGTKIVPLAKWAEIASTYVSHGFVGLRLIARQQESLPFVVAFAAEIVETESVTLLLELGTMLGSPELPDDTAFSIASAFNLLFSFKPQASVTPEQAQQVQAYLFALYPRARCNAERASVVLALRCVALAIKKQYVLWSCCQS